MQAEPFCEMQAREKKEEKLKHDKHLGLSYDSFSGVYSIIDK